MSYAAHGQISCMQIFFIIAYQDTSMRMRENKVMFVQVIFLQVIPLCIAYPSYLLL